MKDEIHEMHMAGFGGQDERKAALAAEYVAKIGYDPFADDPAITVEEVAQILVEHDAVEASQGEFLPLADMDAWEAFWLANADALTESVGDKATCYALACNCELLIGGGAAPLFRVGFVD